MSTTKTKATITVTLTDLENLIRRIVREELARARRAAATSILSDWSQEGPEDAEGDNELLTQALATLKEYEENPAGWKSMDEFEAELARSEAAGELPS